MSYDWDFGAFTPYVSAFLTGAWTAIVLAATSTALGSVAGLGLGVLLRTSFGAFLLWLNDAIRALPILVLMFFFYLFPYQTLGMRPVSPFVAAFLALSISQAVFTADLVRAAINSVSPQALDGARALGFRESAVWRFVVLPDITRQLLPPLMAFFIANVKSTSLASAIGVYEVLFVARIATGTTGRNLEAWLIVAGIYIVLIVPLGWLSRMVEHSQWLGRR